MALTVNTNLSSLVTQRALGSSKSELDQAMERLASGLRVNSASDDAAGLAIGARMESQISAYKMAIRNAEDGISLAQTAEGAMEEITEMLQRMRELAMAAANGTYSQEDRQSLDLEVQQLKEEIDRITMNSVFNGRNLLDGTFQTVMQVGTQSSEAVTVDIANLTTDSLGGISGATVSDAVTAVRFAGTEAEPTVTQLSFQSNDDYQFVLKVTVPKDAVPGVSDASSDITLSYNISGSVVNGGAGDVISAINKALREPADHIAYTNTSSVSVGRSPDATVNPVTTVIPAVADSIRLTYTGKSVTVENLYGMSIGVESGQVPTLTSPLNTYTTQGSLATSGGSLTYTSISGGAGSETRVLGGSGSLVTTFKNAGVDLVATTASVDLSAVTGGAAGDFSFDIDSTTYIVSVTDQDNDGNFDAKDISDSVNRSNAISPALPADFSVGFDGDKLIFTKADGSDFDLKINEWDVSGANILSGDTIRVTDTGGASAAYVSGSTVTFSGGTETDSPVIESVMYLDVLGNDTYKFKFQNNAATPVVQGTWTEVTHNGSTQSLEAMAIEFETALMSMLDKDGNPYAFDVTVVGDRIKIIERNGIGFGIGNFESESQGKVMASNEYGQSPSGQTGATLLDDTVYASDATTTAKQPPVRTDVILSFSEADTYSFTITDGTATAVVNPAEVEDPTDLNAFAGAIRVALRKAGLEGSIDVSVNDNDTNSVNPLALSDSIRLVHRLGKEISIKNFLSVESGEMFVEATTAGLSSDEISSGVTRILNDDTGVNSKRVKDVVITSESLASDSLAILDRAIEDINMERAFLGAIASRLNHTIDNLGNIATNTGAAMSRIMDADYAGESAKLAKAQVLQQAGTAMLAQANASSQTVLALLQG